jgi:hypothetical protein
MSEVNSADAASQTVTPHLVVRDAGAASEGISGPSGPRSAAASPCPAAGSCRSNCALVTRR